MSEKSYVNSTLASSAESFHPAPTTVAELLARANRHGHALEAASEELETMGLDFVVAHATDAAGAPWIVRAPRRPDVVAAARVEARVLALVGQRLPVAVPDWRIHAPDVIAYPRIGGVPAVTVTAAGPQWNIVDPAAPSPAFIESMARALAALQAIAPESAAAQGVPTSTIAATRAKLAAAMAATREALQPSPRMWARWHRWLENDALWPTHTALVHGDLHPGHMLLADDARVIGVLDWTEARVDDPAIDLALFLGCFGRDALERLVERFVAAGGTSWPGLVEHTGERWAAFAVLAAEWALRAGHAGALEHGRAQLVALDAAAD
ncbi:macrolide phosphotransferase [Nannocystis exedens]|uniref:Macrolide phosphotransferase n=1 Tax=Nannocystis exedens TaxID=54 RepID=A0A1I2FKQ3_9BACT|nr:macrolide 2'-phosphotransferase [Nannocystis exedens]PCC74425.1 phosphotransferase [Nannocystis exedens]SFF05613.1 macrolide phosphotransferase [Nannocystis exedens]